VRVLRQGPFDVCPNSLACHAQLEARIRHFASRNALDIRGLGRKTARALVERGLVKNVADVLRLGERDLRSVERFAEVSAKNLAAAIAKARETTLSRFLFALGIPGVGRNTADDLAKHLGTLDAVRRAGVHDLEGTSGIGPSLANAIATFFREPHTARVVDRCFANGLVIASPPLRRGSPGPLAGKNVVLTGNLASLTRTEAENLVRQLGGRATSSVTSKTDLVVAGASPGEKLRRARELGKTTIDEGAFLALARAS
jgi:DNA ligase (NAD+)